jgi:hypothetical protein
MPNTDSKGFTSRISQSGVIGVLRAAALIVLAVGAAGSLVVMFRAGQHTPRLLLVLFTLWVLLPFAVLLLANIVSKRWSTTTRIMLYCTMVIVSLGSLAMYSGWFDVKPAGSANAFLFIAVPAASLIFIAIVDSIAAFIGGRWSRKGGV